MIKERDDIKMLRGGQTWGIDLALSILIFLAALGVIIYVKTTSPSEGYAVLEKESENVVRILLSEGYPKEWTSEDVVKLGLLYENRLSKRKIKELNKMGYLRYRLLLPFVSDFFVILKRNNTIIPIGDECGFGSPDILFEKNITNTTLKTAVYTSQTSSLKEDINATIYSGIELRKFIEELHKYDVVILENPKFLEEKYMKKEAVKYFLENSAEEYKIFILFGDIGVDMFNARFNSANNKTGVVVKDEFGFEIGKEIDFSYSFSVSSNMSNFIPFINNTKDILGAKWVFKDSEIIFLSSTQGTYDGEELLQFIINNTKDIIEEKTAVCSMSNFNTTNPDIENIINIERVTIYESKPVEMEIYFWR